MLHTKFRENRLAGSGEEDFLRVFSIYGCMPNAVSQTYMAAILVM